MIRTSRPILLAGLAFVLAGCMTPDQIGRLERDISDVRVQVDKVEASHERQEEQTSALRMRVEEGSGGEQEWQADLELRLKSLEEQIRVLQEISDQSLRRTDALAAEIASLRTSLSSARPLPSVSLPGGMSAGGSLGSMVPSGATGNSAPGVAGAGVAPGVRDLFNSAYADYSKGNYTLAIQGFEELLRRHGNTELADNALYWIGVAYYDSGNYTKAIEVYDKLLRQHPDGDKAPGAHLKKGLALLEMNRKAPGITELQHLVRNFPESDEARVARGRLIGMGHKPE